MSDQRQRSVLPDVGPTGTSSFEGFVGAEAPRLFAALRLIARDRAEAEDVMLDAFMQVWDRWDRVGTTDDATGQLFRTAMNLYQKRLRQPASPRRRETSSSPFADRIAQLEAHDEVLRALSSLEPRQRLSLVLTDLFGYPSKDTGELMGISASEVRILASEGRVAFKRSLGEADA